MLIFSILLKLLSKLNCLACMGIVAGAIGFVIAMSLLFAMLSGNANVNNCFLYIICVNMPG